MKIDIPDIIDWTVPAQNELVARLREALRTDAVLQEACDCEVRYIGVTFGEHLFVTNIYVEVYEEQDETSDPLPIPIYGEWGLRSKLRYASVYVRDCDFSTSIVTRDWSGCLYHWI